MRKGLLLVAAIAGLLTIGMPVGASGPLPAATAAPSPPPSGTSTDPLAAQLQAALDQQAQIEATKQSLIDAIGAADSAQKSLKALIATNQQTIQNTMASLAVQEQKFRDATALEKAARADAVTALQHEVKDKQILAITVRSGYTSATDSLSFLLSGSSFSDLIQRAEELQRVVKTNGDLIHQVSLDAAAAQIAERTASIEASVAQTAAAKLQSQSNDLQAQTANEANLISQLSSQSQAANKEILAADTQDAALAAQIANLRIEQLDNIIAQAEQAAWDAANYYIQNDLGQLPAGIVITDPNGHGQLTWPALGTVISQGFGPSPYPFEPPYGGFPHFHTGLDLAGKLDTPVHAAADGVVVSALSGSTGYGNNIILVHGNNVLTLYGHLDQLMVTAGQVVHKGDLIGLLGSTGNSTGPHLHFEVRVNNQPVDPIPFLPPLPPGANGP